MGDISHYLILAAVFMLGLRHGIDFDHIAAITDIAGSSKNFREGLWLGFLYIVGHAAVIILLGFLAVFLGVRLPMWIDSFMEQIVGMTLIILGIFLFFSVFRHGKEFKLKSRWMIFFALIKKAFPNFNYPDAFGVKTALMVGVIHAIGAETPTQVLLFVTAAKLSGWVMGSALIIIFVLGLIVSNIVINLLANFGYQKGFLQSRLYMLFGVISAIFSLTVGILFVFGKVTFLPLLF